MKKIILFFIPFILTGCLLSLEKEGISDVTIYKGRVIDSSSKPLSGIPVKITNGTLVYNSTATGTDGLFSVSVDITKIDKNYYIQVGDENSAIKPLRSSLKGFGLDVYDYGDIPYEDIKLPVVETVGLSGVTVNSFTIKCDVKSQGGAPIQERGLCWGLNVPTENDNKVPFATAGEGTYICTVSNADIDISNKTYYARAYAKNEYGYAYGNAIEIDASKLEYFSLPTIEYGGFTYRIYPDMGGMTWSQANSACQNLVAYGFSDWYLPNKEELVSIGAKSSAIQKGNTYWASTPWGDYTNRHYCVVYSSSSNSWVEGNRDLYYDSNVFHVVPVRKDNGESYSGIVQQINGASDCESCNGWTWGSNGTATIGRSSDGGTFYYKDRSFSFLAQRSGAVTLEFKQNDSNYSSWVCMWCNDVAAGTKYATSKEFTKVSVGNVSSNQLVYICGTNVIIRNVKVE